MRNTRVNNGLIITTLLIILLISPVFGVESGRLQGGTYATYFMNQNDSGAGDQSAATDGSKCLNLTAGKIESLNGLNYIYFRPAVYVPAGKPSSANTRFSSEYGNGIIGYEIKYNFAGAQTDAKVYVLFDNPIETSQSGPKLIALNYDATALNGMYISAYRRAGTSVSVYDTVTGRYGATFSQQGGTFSTAYSYQSHSYYGLFLYNGMWSYFKHDYSAELQDNFITGEVTKTVNGVVYFSKVFIYDIYDNILTGEGSFKAANYPFIVPSTSPVKIAIYDQFGTWYNTSYLFSTSSNYTISFSPLSPYANTTVTTSIVPDNSLDNLANIKYIQMSLHQPNGYNAGNKFFARDLTGKYVNFLKNSSGYWGRFEDNGYTFNLGTTTPNNFNVTFPASGEWNTITTIEDVLGNQQTIINNVTVLGTLGKYKLAIYPVDGYDGSFISGSQINLFDDQLKIWTNKTVTEISQCAFPVSTGFYKFEVYAPDDSYTEINQGNLEGVFIVNEDVQTTVTLYPKQTGDNPPIEGDITNSTVFIGVKEPTELKPVYGATITIKPSGQIAKTNSVGIASFNLINGTAYQAVATAQGYAGTTVGFTPNAAVYSFDIALGSNANVPDDYGGYVTPIPSPTRTPAPIITPSAWAEGNASVCGVIADNSSLVDYFKNLAACNGFKDAVSQSLVIAGAIILFSMGLGYAFAKVVGAGVGAIIGFVFAWAIGVIPFFVFVAIIILCCCITAVLLAIKASSGG